MLIKDFSDNLINLPKFLTGIKNIRLYLQDLRKYKQLEGAENILNEDAYPCLYDRTTITGVDFHYFYQGVWAFDSILKSGAKEHVDIGSLVSFVGLLSTITHVTFIDIRPIPIELDNFQMKIGDILSLPFQDNSVKSISCLHVAEHIGLGRYGDSLNPNGTRLAAKELTRVLAPGGILFFSVPIGKPRVCFNAHRIHSPAQILDYFNTLELLEFSGVDDLGKFKKQRKTDELMNSKYGCGFFKFIKK